jgi:hypothetical protein
VLELELEFLHSLMLTSFIPKVFGIYDFCFIIL